MSLTIPYYLPQTLRLKVTPPFLSNTFFKINKILSLPRFGTDNAGTTSTNKIQSIHGTHLLVFDVVRSDDRGTSPNPRFTVTIDRSFLFQLLVDPISAIV